MRNKLLTLAAVVFGTVGLLIATLSAGWGPLLGLDLQGGVSLVLEPTTPTDGDTLDQAIAIIRQRVDGVGVAEPEITRQGGRVVVSLPGTDDQERALRLVGQTAEVRFRPVCSQTFVNADGSVGFDFDDLPVGEDGEGDDSEGEDGEGEDTTDTTAVDGESSDTTTSPTPDTGVDTTDSSDTTEVGLGFGPGSGEVALGLFQDDIAPETTTSDDTTPDDSAPADTTTTDDSSPADSTPDDSAPAGTTVPPATEEQPPLNLDDLGLNGCAGITAGTVEAPTEITTADEDRDGFDQIIVLPDSQEPFDTGDGEEGPIQIAYVLGPAVANGEVIQGAEATLDPSDPAGNTWITQIDTGGPQKSGLDQGFLDCRDSRANCPTNRIAITLDGEVVTAPGVNPSVTDSDGIQITGDGERGPAEELALVLRYGSLPVELEPITQQTVSATIGEDALRAGLISGAVGLSLVALYVIGFYRMLGVIAMASLAISSALLWIIIAYLGEKQGLALTLAGITGIIVSFGVSLDSNVVVFENLRESVRQGRSVRSTVEKSFNSAFSTIVKADVASLIGAVLLYWLTIGSVKGFALFLAIATVLDMVVSWLFLRPALIWLGRSKLAENNPRVFGTPSTTYDDMAEAGA